MYTFIDIFYSGKYTWYVIFAVKINCIQQLQLKLQAISYFQLSYNADSFHFAKFLNFP